MKKEYPTDTGTLAIGSFVLGLVTRISTGRSVYLAMQPGAEQTTRAKRYLRQTMRRLTSWPAERFVPHNHLPFLVQAEVRT